MMVLQAALFYLPYKVADDSVEANNICNKCKHKMLHQVWFFLEGGLIGNFGRDGKAPVSDQNSQSQ